MTTVVPSDAATANPPSPSSSPHPHLSPIYHATVSAPTNIAVIKYWGKANVNLNTPINDSLSLTLDQKDGNNHPLQAITTVAASPGFETDRLWLNGVEVTNPGKRFETVVRHMKNLAAPESTVKDQFGQEHNVSANDWKEMHVHVSSYNTFPTAAGLASSAAGYAALVSALAQLYHAQEAYPGQCSTVARQGSGSACRSLYGGFVAWRQGSEPNWDGTSKAEQVAPESHWPLCAIILVVSSSPKHTSSTEGMQTSVATSSLLQHRAQVVVPQRIHDMEDAIRTRNFDKFAEITMKESNQFHAVCLDTFPPIAYLNDVSHAIIRLVDAYHQQRCSPGSYRCAYTFDAGPNAVLYVPPEHLVEVASLVAHAFGPQLLDDTSLRDAAVDHLRDNPWDSSDVPFVGGVQRVYVTKVGPGPQSVLEVCNLDLTTGLNSYHPPVQK